MSNRDKGQVQAGAAEVYEEFFVPALFAEWAPRVADAAHVGTGMHVLDVACGTGILARTLAERVGPQGSVIGLDRNEEMLAVAQRSAPQLEWQLGYAESLPFAAGRFDAVVSQFGMMFFEDRVKALREMVRVTRPGGSLAFAVWASLESSPGYRDMAALLQRLFGDGVADRLRSPYSLGDVSELRHLCEAAGIRDAEIRTVIGKAHFPSMEGWVYTEIKGWTLADVIDDRQYALLLQEAELALQRYVQANGTVVFDSPAHLVVVRVGN